MDDLLWDGEQEENPICSFSSKVGKHNLSSSFLGAASILGSKYLKMSREESQRDDLLVNLSSGVENIQEVLHQIRKQQVEHDGRSIEQYNALIDKLARLESENFKLRKEIVSIYSPERLARWSLSGALIGTASLGFTLFAGFNIFHPILACSLVFMCLIFFVMSIVMKKEKV